MQFILTKDQRPTQLQHVFYSYEGAIREGIFTIGGLYPGFQPVNSDCSACAWNCVDKWIPYENFKDVIDSDSEKFQRTLDYVIHHLLSNVLNSTLEAFAGPDPYKYRIIKFIKANYNKQYMEYITKYKIPDRDYSLMFDINDHAGMLETLTHRELGENKTKESNDFDLIYYEVK